MPQTNARVESRQIRKPNLVVRSYEKRPCSIKSLIFWRIPRFFPHWISQQPCIHLYYVISYSGPTHFELSWHEMHMGKHNQNCGEYWRMLRRHVLWKNALSIGCFSACNSSMHFFLLANLHGCMWTVSTGVRQIPSYHSYQLSPTNVRSSLLWLICQSGGWFFNHSLIKSIIASFAPGRAVITLMRCAPALNATIGHWMKKGLRLPALAGLAGSMLSHQVFPRVQVRSHLTPKFGIWSCMKSTEIISANILWFMRFYDSSRSYCICLEKFDTIQEWKLGMVAVGFDDWWWKSGD